MAITAVAAAAAGAFPALFIFCEFYNNGANGSRYDKCNDYGADVRLNKCQHKKPH